MCFHKQLFRVLFISFASTESWVAWLSLRDYKNVFGGQTKVFLCSFIFNAKQLGPRWPGTGDVGELINRWGDHETLQMQTWHVIHKTTTRCVVNYRQISVNSSIAQLLRRNFFFIFSLMQCFCWLFASLNFENLTQKSEFNFDHFVEMN